MSDRKPSPANGGALRRCGLCERKLVVFYLASMAENVLKDEAPGELNDKAAMSKALMLATHSIKRGVHECGAPLLGECSRCDEDADE